MQAPMTKKVNTVYEIHFGTAKHNHNLKTKINISYHERKSLLGTVHYMSTNMILTTRQAATSLQQPQRFQPCIKVLSPRLSTMVHGMVSRLQPAPNLSAGTPHSATSRSTLSWRCRPPCRASSAKELRAPQWAGHHHWEQAVCASIVFPEFLPHAHTAGPDFTCPQRSCIHLSLASRLWYQ